MARSKEEKTTKNVAQSTKEKKTTKKVETKESKKTQTKVEVKEKKTSKKVKEEPKKVEVKEIKKEEKISKKESKKTSKKEEPKKEVVRVDKKAVREKKEKKSRTRKFFRSLFLSLVILAASVALMFPIIKEVKYGLDLKGGFEILYEVQDTDGKKVSKESVTNTYKTILKRIDILGVSEPEITIEGNNIRIQLAGIKDSTEAKKTLSSMANLTFRNSKDELVMTSDVLKPNGVKLGVDDKKAGVYYLSIGIKDVDTFHKKTEEIRKSGDYIVTWLDFDEKTDSFAKELENGTCGSLNNSRCISYASIASELTTDEVQLTGNFSYEEANSLKELINSGSLPTKLVEKSSKTVDASFGEDALEKTYFAGIIAIALIVLLLIVLYRFSGFIASIGIVVYTMLTFAMYNLVDGRLTLPSIAALIIGIGMAVDSVVLSFERVKDELRKKNTLEDAFKEGNKESLVSIIDANITTLIAAGILFTFGESSVKGFATMLIVSVIVTLLVMVYLVRALLRGYVASKKFDNHLNAFVGLKHLDKKPLLARLNYAKYGLKFAVMSIVVLIAGGIYLYFNGLNLSIDFKGGSTVTINAKDNIKASAIKTDLKELGYEVKNSDQINEKSVYVTINKTLESNDVEKIENHFEKKYEKSTTSIGSVSNTVKKELIKNAVKSLLYAIVGIIIYVTLRFTFRYGVSSILTLVHDSLMIVIVFSLFRLEVSTIFIAAILSIIGYSINDTIVTFDRIRENKRKLYKDKLKSYDELKDLVNKSIQDTITRNLITALTTFIPIVCLMIFGSHEINNFNYALFIGMIAGTYSSIYLATFLWMIMEKRHIGKPEKKKWYEVDDNHEPEELKVKGINC